MTDLWRDKALKGQLHHQTSRSHILETEELEHFVGNLARAESGAFFPFGEESEVTGPRTEFVHFSQDTVVVS